MKQLDLPKSAIGNREAVEFLRAWLHGETIEFASLGNIFAEPEYIGIFLADLLRHLVSGSDLGDAEKARQTQRAAAAFNAEIA